MSKFIKPNWGQSNLNISATLAEFLGAPNKNKTLPILKTELSKGYKNVVFICFDGMGIYPINKNLDESSILRKNIKQVLTSTFPSTTTNATTSLACNKFPLEHGWFGWSLHFDGIKRNVDIYLKADSQTGEKIDYSYPIMDNTDCYFNHSNSEYEVNSVLPIYVKTKNEDKKVSIQDEFELCDAIRKICLKDGKQFIYAYLPEPDSTMHEFGVTSKETKQKIDSINNQIEKLYNELNDTLIIITADHGQIDVDGYIEFYKDNETNDLLEYVPYLDARTPAFKVKKGKEKEFEIMFEKKYGDDFKLFKSSDLVKDSWFGERGGYAYMLGDYIAIGVTHKEFISYENMKRFKGHHTSVTEEMEVPLILLSK